MVAHALECKADDVAPAAEARGGVYAVVPGDVQMTEEERKALACEPINRLEAALIARAKLGDYPVYDQFIPQNGGTDSGMYIREAFLPVGIYTTEIHRSEHPYVLFSGKVRVWTQGDGWKTITGPYRGTTKSGTRRVIIVEEPAVWTTYHAVNSTDVKQIRQTITLPHVIVADTKAPEIQEAIAALQ